MSKNTQKQPKFYDLHPLLKKYPDADFYIIYGKKSRGKTYAINEYCLNQYLETGGRSVYVRRWTEDIKSPLHRMMFADMYRNHPDLSEQYSGINLYRSEWWLMNHEKKREESFMLDLSLGGVSHTNGASDTSVKTIFFDEFMDVTYLPDEYVRFQKIISNVIRSRGDVKIFMAANPLNFVYCPYFDEIGFNPERLEQGASTLIVAENGGRYAIERTQDGEKTASDKYFNGGSVSMITRGAWDMAEYPKAPTTWSRRDVQFRVFVKFKSYYIAGDFVTKDGGYFLYFYPKKQKKILHPETDIVFTDSADYRRNFYSTITRPIDDISRLIAEQFQAGKVFYSDDATGEILRNYIEYSVQKTGLRRL